MISRLEYEGLVAAALREDAPFGDPFGSSFSGKGRGSFVAGAKGVFCGGMVAVEVFRQVDPTVAVTFLREGTRVSRGMKVGGAEGTASSLLRGERVVLNFIQRLSGVAPPTAAYAERGGPHATRIR